jgi:tetratricopeptide (TPR) repeat protein
MTGELVIDSVRAAEALRRCGNELAALGDLSEALALYNLIISRFSKAREPALREQVAKALFNKGWVLDNRGDSEDAIGVYDDVVARFGEASEPALREEVAMALVNKGIMLDERGDSEQAIGVYDDVVARFGEASDPALRREVARALVDKGWALDKRGDSEQAIGVYDDVVARFGEPSEPALRREVARAIFYKGGVLDERGDSEQAIGVYDVFARFGEASDPALRKHVARILRILGYEAQAATATQEGGANLASDDGPAQRRVRVSDSEDDKDVKAQAGSVVPFRHRLRIMAPATDRGGPVRQLRQTSQFKPDVVGSFALLYNITMDNSAAIADAARKLPDEQLKELMRAVAAELSKRETVALAAAAPRRDWVKAHKRGVTVPEFIKEAFAVELADGTMSKALFSRYENLRRDFYSYKRSNELPDWLRAIPTKAKLNTQRLAKRAETGKPVRPAPRPRTEEQRLYDTAVKRRTRAGLAT